MSDDEECNLFKEIKKKSTGYLINLKKSQDILTNSKPKVDYTKLSFIALLESIGFEEDNKYDPETFWSSFSLFDFKKESTVDEIHSATKELISLMLSNKENRKEVAECAANLAIFLRNFPSDNDNDDDKVKLIAELANPTKIESKMMKLPTYNEANKYVGPDKWKINLIDSLDKSPKFVSYWGPAFACLVMRLETQTPNAVAKKIKQLEKNLNYFLSPNYGYIKVPEGAELEQLLTKYRGIRVEPGLKNSVFIRFVLAYHDSKITSNEMGVLDFLLLQSMEFKGLSLIRLVSQVQDRYTEIHWSDLIKFTLVPKSVMSWVAYWKLIRNFGEWKLRTDKVNLWRYARAFSSDVFTSLSYSKNSWLCNLMASILDMPCVDEKHTSYPFYGPIYTRIHAQRRNCYMTELDYEVAIKLSWFLSCTNFWVGSKKKMEEALKNAALRNNAQ